MGKYFGTDGVRGVANVELTPQMAFALGKYGAYVLKKKENGKENKIIIGRDTRLSGTMLESAFAAGACSVGVNVVLLGVVPTACVAHLVRKYNALAGVVISASHNPAADNGIKFFSATGYKLPDDVENEIENLIDENAELEQFSGLDLGVVTSCDTAQSDYIAYLKECFDLDLSGLKVVLDCANGASSYIVPELFAGLGCETEIISASPDGWNINFNCGSTSINSLAFRTAETKADIGLAFDGDADRLIAVDENGNVIDGDKIMTICALDLKAKGKLKGNSISVTVMSNLGLQLALEEQGIDVQRTKVGDRYVLENLLANGGNFGGEQSGHIIFTDYNTTGDGIITALYLLGVLKASGKKASELAAQMQSMPQVLQNVRVASKAGWDVNAAIGSAVTNAENILNGSGRVLVRPSGTEPLLRVMLEGKNQAQLEDLASSISAVIKQELG